MKGACREHLKDAMEDRAPSYMGAVGLQLTLHVPGWPSEGQLNISDEIPVGDSWHVLRGGLLVIRQRRHLAAVSPHRRRRTSLFHGWVSGYGHLQAACAGDRRHDHVLAEMPDDGGQGLHTVKANCGKHLKNCISCHNRNMTFGTLDTPRANGVDDHKIGTIPSRAQERARPGEHHAAFRLVKTWVCPHDW